MTCLNMEAVAEMPASLINIEFERMLYILDKQYESELFLMGDAEKKQCVGTSKTEPYLMYYNLHRWM